ncbi:hypothetical protein B296_00017865 [Ensete ventricosum]|uniref:BZIP domain-containing protein n=1 Tax=Ensete ventricosum TaxID=4639 RepID=A0A427ALM5_ENSVE|nr:hypothetical protein B296_00017865 [Ensete ventricosum]
MLAAGVPAAVAGPTTNLNIGMDYWVAPTPSVIPPVHGKVPATTNAGATIPGTLVRSSEKVPSEIWLQVVAYFSVKPVTLQFCFCVPLFYLICSTLHCNLEMAFQCSLLFDCMVLDEFRMNENSKDREESSQTGNPHVDLGCASRYNASSEYRTVFEGHFVGNRHWLLSCYFQAEYEELAQRVEVLKEENSALRSEVDRVKKEYDELLSQNTALQVSNFIFICSLLFSLEYASCRNDAASWQKKIEENTKEHAIVAMSSQHAEDKNLDSDPQAGQLDGKQA